MTDEINPWSPHLTKVEQQLVIDRCRESPAYFFSIVRTRSISPDVQSEMSFHASWIDHVFKKVSNDQQSKSSK